MTDDEVRERLRFLAAAQHETNTPLAIIRGWAETFATMWEDLHESERRQGTVSIRRYAIVLTDVIEALFVELRADAHTRTASGATADLAEVVARAVQQTREASLAGMVPEITARGHPDAIEALLGAATGGLAMRSGGLVSVAVEEHPDGALVTVSPAADGGSVPGGRRTSDGAPGPDPFDPFPGGEPSPAGIRLYAARRLALALGGRLWSAEGDQLRIVLPRT